MKLDNKGFTLIEVLAVIVILSIVSGIAINGVLSAINNSKNSSYNIMIKNIITASVLLYEEVDNNKMLGSDVYRFDSTGKSSDKIEIDENNNSITTNLQTLVSNGFLTGSNNDCSGDGCNNNKKILKNPKTEEDIGYCEIKIIKNNNGAYSVNNNSHSDNNCPDSYRSSN